MRRQLLIFTTLIVFVGFVCIVTASLYSASVNNRRIAEDNITETARIFASLYTEDTDPAAFVNIGGTTRITIIDSGGNVLADTNPIDTAALETHLDRPEIAAAQSGTPAVFTRYSSTLGVYMIYYALMVDIQGGDDFVFVRTSASLERVDTYFAQSVPLLIIVFIIISLFCFLMARTMVTRITKPLESVKKSLGRLSEGKYIYTSAAGSFEEFDAIFREIDDVAQVLQESIKELSDEKTKAEYIINNISDGIFALSLSKDIVLINNAALGIFDVTQEITGKSIQYLTFNSKLLDAIDECINLGSSALSELSIDGKTYILTVKRMDTAPLIMVILSDITDSRESAGRREEFFDNASHELKTPLTAIKGFAELCALDNKDEKIKKYIDSITRETERMLNLISDMLKLSELSNTPELTPVPVCVHEIAEDIRETLSTAVSEKSLSIDVDGQLTVMAEKEHVYELLKNLIENAVRYNTDGGSVNVALGDGFIKVADTGIGIPGEAQSRLFERFYRVEKSRSIRSGGTGLGLSIVKHICSLYNWGLTLKSKPGVGTEVVVSI